MGLSLSRKKIFAVGAILAVLVVGIIGAQLFGGFLATRAPDLPQQDEHLVGGVLGTDQLSPGQHTLSFRAQTADGRTVEDEVTFVVQEPAPTPVPTPAPEQTTPELLSVCIDPVDFEVGVRWSPGTGIVRHRLAGQQQWHFPFGDEYEGNEQTRRVLLFNPFVGPEFNSSYPLEPNTDFELQIVPGQDSPESFTSSEIFRFNSGPGPKPNNEHRGEPRCEFRQVYPPGQATPEPEPTAVPTPAETPTPTPTAAPSCGDGVINDGEECDDGNTQGGDGCSSTCFVEAGYTCSGEPSSCSIENPFEDIIDLF